MKLPISESLLSYFDQVRHEKAWHHERKNTDKEEAARKKGQYKKYKHKEESTATERIEEYRVKHICLQQLTENHQKLECSNCGIHFSEDSQGWMEVHKRNCVEKDQEIILTKDLKLPDCYVWIPLLEIPGEKTWEQKGKQNVEKYQHMPEEAKEGMANEVEG